ncbi:MAG: hypothetical protein K2Q22_08135, partial [Cytophagales bacterium]|nr:hypothetical protein [Cytophagales bacterium]
KSAKETEFITKLVNAVGIHMKDVQIRSYADADSVESKKAILFLTSPEKAKGLALFESYNQELSKYSPFNVYNQQIIWGDGLDSIMESVDLKKSLWGSLKIMFGLA